MKKFIIALTSLVLSMMFVTLLVSCNNDDDDATGGGDTQQSSQGNVYVVGYTGDADAKTAVLWNNGQTTTFPYIEAYSVAVSGNDVYVTGNKDYQSCYWKVGQPETPTLLNGSFIPRRDYGYSGNSIAISGNDVYVGGSDESTQHPVYWKNGQKVSLPFDNTPLDTNNEYGWVTGIAVSGNDVYATGGTMGYTDVFGKAVYWKNGEQFILPKNENYPTYATEAEGIAVSGSDVYVCGSQSVPDDEVRGVAVYWKNGRQITLSTVASEAFGIAVSGNDVYVCGYAMAYPSYLLSAVYWKNGQLITLAQNAEAVGIIVSGNDVYVCGNVYDDDDNSTAVYWKNGKQIELGTGEASGIAIK